MPSIVDLNVKIGSSSSNMSSLPCAINTPMPIISWELPNNIKQERFNIRIKPVNNNGLFINGSLVSSQTTFQYPSTSRMNYKYYGLCCLEIAISSKTSGEYEYTTGELYFVYDDVLEILRVDDAFVFRWDNSSDAETSWQDMKYNLVVSSSPLFEEENILFDDLVDATSKNETSCIVNIEDCQYEFIYWKVRAFDGLDYGDFTQVNAFRVTNNEPPIVEINSITVNNNKAKDVDIDFTLYDSEKERINLEVYYCGGTVGEKFVLASLLNSVVCVKPGTYKITWRSSLDEKKIESSDYAIKIVAIDEEGLSGEDVSDKFYMNNLSVGADPGGEASLNNDYTLTGKIAIINRFNIQNDEFALSCRTKTFDYLYSTLFPNISGSIGTFRTYRTGGLKYPLSSPDVDFGSGPDDWVFDKGGGGGGSDDKVEPEYPKGMMLFQGNSSPGKGTDLDSGDPDFVRDIEHVDENGNYWEMDERVSYKNAGDNLRWGYARFVYCFYGVSESKCNKCGGKGWFGVEEDDSIPKNHKYRYKRKICTDCLGNRFTSEPNISPDVVELVNWSSSVGKGETIVLKGGKNLIMDGFRITNSDGDVPSSGYTVDLNKNSVTFNRGMRDVSIFYKMEKYSVRTSLFMISKWIPLEEYFSPLKKTDIIHNFKLYGKVTTNSYRNFLFNPMPNSEWFSEYKYGDSNSKSGYRFKRGNLPKNTYYQIDCPLLKNRRYTMDGTYNGTSFIGRVGIKTEATAHKENFRLMGNAHVEKLKLQEDISALNGKTTNLMKEYIPGTTYTNSILASGRKTPTHRYEPGILIMNGYLHRENELGSLKIIFLQSSWQVYNTIHWSGPGSASTLTQVQYCKINQDGSNGVFYDVIAENSDFYEEHGVWLVPAQTWHCFWRTEDQIDRDSESSYRLRIRQYNIVSKTFSSWSYSETTFMLTNSATNPASIYYTEYFKFSKKLYIYYRLDDKDNEAFNIVSVAYRVNGGNWITIDQSRLEGSMYSLSSASGADGNGNKHLIVWDTSSANLIASDDYRIRIEVIKTKLALGYSLPILKWYKTPNTTSDIQEKTVETYEGAWVRFYKDEQTEEPKALPNPVYVPGRIKELEDKIFELKCQNEPLPSSANGYFTFVDGVEVIKEGNKIISANIVVENGGAVLDHVEIDGRNYFAKDWLNYKIDGVSRNTLLYNYSNEINEAINIANSAREIIDEARKYTRRNLIDQGYYCNGFKNNTPVYIQERINSNSSSETIDENSYFKFKVLTYFEDSINEYGFFAPKYSEYLGDTLFTETITDSKGNGETVTNTYTYHEYERTSHVFSRIMMDKYFSFNSQNGKPMRDIIFDEYGERIATKIGGEEYTDGKSDGYHPVFDDIPTTNDSGYVDTSTEQKDIKSQCDVFSIPLSMLPGERAGDTVDADTFEGNYYWKVSSYNLLYGRPEEKPEFSATNTYNRDIVRLTITTKAPEGLVSAKINDIKYVDRFFDKYLIERDCSNSESKSYFDEENYLYGSEIVEETVFVTDPPDYAIENGYCSDFTWTPLSKHRTRPVVIVDNDNEKHFWYIKKNNSGSNIICHAKGKTFFRVGEYDTAIPHSNVELYEESDEFKSVDDVFSHSIVKINKNYMMYYITNSSSEYSVKVSTSSNGNEWSHGNVSINRAGIYNIFATAKGYSIKIFYCVHENGMFNVYSSESLDGSSFINEKLEMSSENAISNIFAMNDGDILFYTEEYIVDGNYRYKIKCSSEQFPEIDNASNPFIIKDGLGYRMFFDRDGKIYSVFLKNYIEKGIVKEEDYLSSVISGNISNVYCSVSGSDTIISINRAYQYGWTTYCTDEFRTMNLDDILGWVIKGDNNAVYKEYRIEGQFLTRDNVDSVNGMMEPYPFKYMYLIKDLY